MKETDDKQGKQKEIVGYFERSITLDSMLSTSLDRFYYPIEVDKEKEAKQKRISLLRLKCNPFKFLNMFLIVSFDIMKARRSPSQLINYTSMSVYEYLEKRSIMSMRENKKELPSPIKIVSMRGYRVSNKISEMSATILDKGAPKICVVRAEFLHNKWKVTYFHTIEPQNTQTHYTTHAKTPTNPQNLTNPKHNRDLNFSKSKL
jgi:hypothetical protein